MVTNIIKRVHLDYIQDLIDNEGISNVNDKYYTNAASDIFNILGPAFAEALKRHVDSLTLRMLDATRELVRYYAASATNTLIGVNSYYKQTPKLTNEQLIAVLNNEEKFFDGMQLYLDQSISHLSSEESKSTGKSNFGIKDTMGSFRKLSMASRISIKEMFSRAKQSSRGDFRCICDFSVRTASPGTPSLTNSAQSTLPGKIRKP